MTEVAVVEAPKEAAPPAGDVPEKAKEVTASPKKAPPKPSVHKVDYEQDTVYLYQFPRSPVAPSISAYCLKVETFLRAAEIKYENLDNRRQIKSKKGQLPFIELNGEEINDSDIILRQLSKRYKSLNEGLTEEQKVASHAFESMLNNHTAWIVRWWRFANPDLFLAASQIDLKTTYGSKLPSSLLNMVFKWAFRRNSSAAVSQGIGRHSPQEVIEFCKADLQALSDYLGTKDFFFGKAPHQLDIVAFAHLVQIIYFPFEGLKEWMDENTSNLVLLVERVKGRYWNDWDEICSTLELNTHLPKKELTPEEVEAQKKAEEKRAEEAKKKEEKKQQKVSKKSKKSKGSESTNDTDSPSDPESPTTPSNATGEAADASTTSTSTARRIPSFAAITRRLSNRNNGEYRIKQEERKKAKEEAKQKAKEEREQKKKEAEEAKAKVAAEKAEKEQAEQEKKDEATGEVSKDPEEKE